MASGGDAEEIADDKRRKAGKIEYPIHVDYCGICTLPPEVNDSLRLRLKIHAYL